MPPVGAGQLPVATQPCAPAGHLPSLGGPGRGCRGNPGHGDEGRRRAGRWLAGHAASGSCPGRARPWPRRRPQLRGQLAAFGRDPGQRAGRGGGWRLRPGSARRPCLPTLELRAPPGYAVPQVSPAAAVAGDRVLTPGTFPGPATSASPSAMAWCPPPSTRRTVSSSRPGLRSCPVAWTTWSTPPRGNEPGAFLLVGKGGFEPPASASRTLRANQAALLPVRHSWYSTRRPKGGELIRAARRRGRVRTCRRRRSRPPGAPGRRR